MAIETEKLCNLKHLFLREVFEYKIGCNQLVNNICFICLEDDSLNNC